MFSRSHCIFNSSKSYTHQNSSTISSQCKGSTKQPTHYYTLHHGILHSVIKATRAVTCHPETCLFQQYPPRERTSPLSFCNLGPHHLNHAWQIVSKHTVSNTTSDMLASTVLYKWTGTNIYCETSSLALSWCPLINTKNDAIFKWSCVYTTHKKVACLLISSARINPQPTIRFCK